MSGRENSPFSKSHFSQNSQFSESHFSQNSHFSCIKFLVISGVKVGFCPSVHRRSNSRAARFAAPRPPAGSGASRGKFLELSKLLCVRSSVIGLTPELTDALFFRLLSEMITSVFAGGGSAGIIVKKASA